MISELHRLNHTVGGVPTFYYCFIARQQISALQFHLVFNDCQGKESLEYHMNKIGTTL